MSREIRVLHLEPTDVCQAFCPLCARETDTDFDKNVRHHLNIDQIMQHISIADIQRLHKMFMCGNYGDPAAGRYTLEIFQHFRALNPRIVLGMNTNGALQNVSWWQNLGHLLSQNQDYVVFSIDGLEDTNHVYRRGVVWHKLIENAQAYIRTGASAHWDMLVYRHNEHQVDACERLARDLGFTWFRAKISNRPLVQGLDFPVTWHHSVSKFERIDCHAIREKSIYIDAQGRQSPCCWLGARQENFVLDIAEVITTWKSKTPDPVCLTACGRTNQTTNFESQWRREVQLC